MAEGNTMGGTLGPQAPLKIRHALAPGECTVRVFEYSAKDGSVTRLVAFDVTIGA